MKRIAIFASGNGTNAEALMEYFKDNPAVRCELMICDRQNAGVYGRCYRFGVETRYFPKRQWTELQAANVMDLLAERGIDLIVLAGFFAILPDEMVRTYRRRIINIHPSLLPKYGGKGMWGMHVHQAVIDNRELKTGITIHYVSEEVDGGQIICQEHCDVMPGDTPETLAQRVRDFEHYHYPRVIEKILMGD